MEKILTFIVNKDNKLLLLLGSSNDPQFHKSFWYTVTGAKEDFDEDLFSESQEDEEEQNTDEISAENWQGDDDITTDDDENFEVTLNDLGEI